MAYWSPEFGDRQWRRVRPCSAWSRPVSIYGSARVFGGVSFLLDGARTALVGENGAGKSTLLKCLPGELELNGGKVVRSRGLCARQRAAGRADGLAERPVRDVLHARSTKVGLGDDYWRIDVLLDEIGVEPETLDRAFGTLSGGWQRLLLIAAAARLEEPDILVLDEPTNHLDLANINTLERWLTVEFTVPMLIVSHDREFLDRVTERTLFLRSDGMHAFKTRFSQAREELLRRDAAAARAGAAGGQGDPPARAGGGALQGLGGQESRPQQAQERRRDAHRPHREGAHADLCRARAAAGTERRRHRRQGGAAHRRARRHGARQRPQAAWPSTGWPSPPATASPCLGANGAGKSTLLSALADAFDPALEHYDSLAAGALQSVLPAGLFRPVHARPAARPVDPRLRRRRPGSSEKDAIRYLAQAGFAFAKHRRADRRAEPRRARATGVPEDEAAAAQHLPAGRADQPSRHRGPGGSRGAARAERRVVPVRQPRPLLHAHGGHALPGDPQGPAGRDRRCRSFFDRPEVPRRMDLPLDDRLRSACKPSTAAPNPPPAPGCRRSTSCATLVELVDRCGYDSLWVGDHVSFPSPSSIRCCSSRRRR